MDKVYDLNGEIKQNERENTHLYVPNSFIIELSKKYACILFGASVHPYRKDWKEELEFCIQNGAVLCKWIPSSQQIDVTNQKCFPIYDFLAQHKLPLLIHSGPEYSIPTSDDSFIEMNNPKYLRPALERGVTIIIAHCALPYFGEFDTKYLDDMAEFYKLFEESKNKPWELYADLSALAEPLRNTYIPEIKARIPQDRILFGSDYPLPASELSFKKTNNIFKWIKLTVKAFTIGNPIDKNYFVINKMGFDKAIFTNASGLFERIIRN
jgi:mannonate dehydratase